MDTIAATKLSDVLRPKAEGEPVNVHVVKLQPEPKPDFDAMRKLVAGSDDRKRETSKERAVSENK